MGCAAQSRLPQDRAALRVEIRLVARADIVPR
jgi:hypothetical protein